MTPMPNKDPTLWALLLAWLMDNWPAVYGALLAFALAFFRVTYSGCRGRQRLIEATLCGLITLAAATATQLIGIPEAATPFVGGVVGLLGVDIIRDKATTLVRGKGDHHGAQ